VYCTVELLNSTTIGADVMGKHELLEKYVDVLEASRVLNIHPESVRRLIRQGKLPGIRFSNKWLIERDVLEQFASHYDPRPGQKATLL
jgi:excisionase family DNA binding protein